MKLERQFNEIRDIIIQAKEKAFIAINTHLIDLYWNVGKYISVKINQSKWGKSVVDNLSDYLKQAEPELKGFSSQNLWRMKQFFETYYQDKKLSSLVREINWTNNMIII